MVRTVLVTGANSGIGYAIATFLAKSGQYDLILGCRTLAKGQDAVGRMRAQLGTEHVKASAIELDVDDIVSIRKAADAVRTETSKLDVLINNAGVYNAQEVLEIQLAQTYRTNVIGPALVTEAFKPLLLKSPNPYLLHIGSTLGSLATTADAQRSDAQLRCIGYRASKAALSMLAIEHHKELYPRGVKVFLLCPGLVESRLRGPDRVAQTANGAAAKAETAAEFVASIICGERDHHVGLFISRQGIIPW